MPTRTGARTHPPPPARPLRYRGTRRDTNRHHWFAIIAGDRRSGTACNSPSTDPGRPGPCTLLHTASRGYRIAISVRIVLLPLACGGPLHTVPQPPPCPNTGLFKPGDPVFPPFWAFFGTIVFAVPIQQRMWAVALCRLQEGSIWVAKCWCSCTSLCSLCSGVYACLGHPFVVMNISLFTACNMCPVVHAAR